MESGSIAAWHVKSGDTFQAGDVFCSVETDKATVDFEAQDDGVVAKIFVAANGGDVPVGAPIFITVQDTEHVAAFADYQPTTTVVADVAVVAAAPAVAAPVAVAPATASTNATNSGSGGDSRVVASPLARLLAQEMGYDIAR